MLSIFTIELVLDVCSLMLKAPTVNILSLLAEELEFVAESLILTVEAKLIVSLLHIDWLLVELSSIKKAPPDITSAFTLLFEFVVESFINTVDDNEILSLLTIDDELLAPSLIDTDPLTHILGDCHTFTLTLSHLQYKHH